MLRSSGSLCIRFVHVLNGYLLEYVLVTVHISDLPDILMEILLG